ncbi:MAG: helix-turn-helix domain-containing protein [Actinomycetota bacterium]
MLDVDVIDDRRVALAALDPVRARVLGALAEPGSATTVAAAIGETRQKVNYHLRTLEEHGLVDFVEERPRRGLTERVLVASARSYVLAPDVMGESAPDPRQLDRLSAQYLVAVAGRIVSEVGDLARRARRADKSLATLTIAADIRFASAADRAAFTDELSGAVTDLVARYHTEHSPNGRWHRLVVAAHPAPAGGSTSTTNSDTDTPHESVSP